MENRNEIDFILCAHPGIVQDVEVLDKVGCRGHWMVRSRFTLDVSRERNKLIRKKPIDKLAVRGTIEEFRISLQYRYSAQGEQAFWEY